MHSSLIFFFRHAGVCSIPVVRETLWAQRGNAEFGRRSELRFPVALALALAAAATPAVAQEHDAQLWLTANASTELREGLKLELETNQRFSDDSGELYESQYLAALTVQVATGVTLTGGLNRVVRPRDGKVQNTEWRPRQQIGFAIAKLGSGQLAGRVRLEQRFRSDDSETGHRVRPEITYTLPVYRNVKLRLAHESYFNLNSTGFQDRGHERMRNWAIATVPVTKNLSAQLGYMNQYRFNDEAPDVMEHGLMTALYVTF